MGDSEIPEKSDTCGIGLHADTVQLLDDIPLLALKQGAHFKHRNDGGDLTESFEFQRQHPFQQHIVLLPIPKELSHAC